MYREEGWRCVSIYWVYIPKTLCVPDEPPRQPSSLDSPVHRLCLGRGVPWPHQERETTVLVPASVGLVDARPEVPGMEVSCMLTLSN